MMMMMMMMDGGGTSNVYLFIGNTKEGIPVVMRMMMMNTMNTMEARNKANKTIYEKSQRRHTKLAGAVVKKECQESRGVCCVVQTEQINVVLPVLKW